MSWEAYKISALRKRNITASAQLHVGLRLGHRFVPLPQFERLTFKARMNCCGRCRRRESSWAEEPKSR